MVVGTERRLCAWGGVGAVVLLVTLCAFSRPLDEARWSFVVRVAQDMDLPQPTGEQGNVSTQSGAEDGLTAGDDKVVDTNTNTHTETATNTNTPTPTNTPPTATTNVNTETTATNDNTETTTTTATATTTTIASPDASPSPTPSTSPNEAKLASDSSCIGWRQTTNCNPLGAREQSMDKGCDETVHKDWSGYCECEGGVRVGEVGCGHTTFNCSHLCWKLKNPQREAHGCEGWRQTGNCDPNGQREESSDQECSTPIQSEWSGYCLCNGEKRGGVGCGHQMFTCADICSGKKPKTLSGLDNEPHVGNGIPKIIHQTWKSHEVQSVFRPYVQSWIRLHPDWEYYFWTDDDNRELIRRYYNEYLGLFDGYHGWARGVQRADVIRYFILHRYGGVYVDLDFESLRPLDSLLQNRECVIGAEPTEHATVLYDLDLMLCNAFMACSVGHTFWTNVFKELQHRRGQTDPVQSTGPRMLQHVLTQYSHLPESTQHPVVVLPPKFLYPKYDPYAQIPAKCQDINGPNRRSSRQIKMCEQLAVGGFANDAWPEAFAMHHWSHTWLGQVEDRTLFNVFDPVLQYDWKDKLNTARTAPQSTNNEPDKIHHVWPERSIPSSSSQFVRSWALLYPTAQQTLWNADGIYNLAGQWENIVLRLRSMEHPSVESWQSLACLVVVFKQGGICVSLGAEAKRPINVLLGASGDLAIAADSEPNPEKAPNLNVFGGPAEHAVWKDALEQLSNVASSKEVISSHDIQLALSAALKTRSVELLPAWTFDGSQMISFVNPHSVVGGPTKDWGEVLGSLPHGWQKEL